MPLTQTISTIRNESFAYIAQTFYVHLLDFLARVLGVRLPSRRYIWPSILPTAVPSPGSEWQVPTMIELTTPQDVTL